MNWKAQAAELENLLRTGLSAAREFADAIRQEWAGRVNDVRLYGSFARGDAGLDSDVDVLVLVDRRRPEDRDRAAQLAFRIGTLKHEVVILPVVFSRDEFAGLLKRERAFALSAVREGIDL